MSELLNNSEKRKALLKHMILQLHEGEAPEDVRQRLISLMAKVPYQEVVDVEQELISEGVLSDEEVLKFCDLHTQALEGAIDTSNAKEAPKGHPVDVFIKENRELLKVVRELDERYHWLGELSLDKDIPDYFIQLRTLFNQLMDVDKHYLRKENLLFPFLEKKGITGPPKVMWGKHDETRELLKAAIEALTETLVNREEARTLIELVLKPASDAVADMTMKEEEILFPMAMDKLTDKEWYDIAKQTSEYGYCLYDPDTSWKPDDIEEEQDASSDQSNIKLPNGSFSAEELLAILNTIPVDMTFVDRNDKVKYFSQGEERIFSRSRAILNRDVRLCHPPSSVHVVDDIVNDFKNGKQDRAPFWIQKNGKFIHIEYFALRNEKGEYLGTLEVSQDLTEKRKLIDEQRILSYGNNEKNE